MRTEGTLTTWNDKRGFGYISPTQGGPEIFVHASAFPQDGHPPTVGERLSVEVETSKDHKLRAKNLRRPGRRTMAPDPHLATPHRHDTRRIFGLAMAIVALLGLAAFGFSESSRRSAPQTQQASKPKSAPPSERTPTSMRAANTALVRH